MPIASAAIIHSTRRPPKYRYLTDTVVIFSPTSSLIITRHGLPTPAAILHPADPDRWCHHRHGRHPGGYRPRLAPPHVGHHRGSGERWLQWHADAGRWRRNSKVTQGRARPSRHRPVCAVPELQTRMHRHHGGHPHISHRSTNVDSDLLVLKQH